MIENSNPTNQEVSDKLETILDRFYHWEATQPDSVYLKQPVGDEWLSYTWREVGQQVRRMAKALQSRDLAPGSHIGIISKNCAHWLMADLAILIAGHISVPFYPTLTADKLAQVLEQSDCATLFVGKLDEWENLKTGVPADLPCISFPPYASSVAIEGLERWNDIVAAHEPLEENFYPEMEDLCTIIYTSGTTGMPKGVMHTHGNLSRALNHTRKIFNFEDPNNRFFSYLPLCHIAERNIVECAALFSGGTVYFSESLATFNKNLQDAQPTHFIAVPRIWTKFQLAILSQMPQAQLDQALSNPQMAPMVQQKVKKTLGLSSAELILTGAAPMPSSLIDWFAKLDIKIQEVYGMTENVGLSTFMRKDNIKMGTVGQAYPGAEVKIDEESGEVLVKAPWLMTGYYKHEEKSAETLKGGWLHTGDMGSLDEQGFLKITGRVKDTFKTAKGEFVQPAPIESRFATNNHIEQICLLGRGLPQPVALVVLSEMGQSSPSNQVDTSLQDSLAQANESVLNHERVEKIILMKEPWTVDNGLLTPTLKVKRNVLEERYAEQLESWYQTPERVIREN